MKIHDMSQAKKLIKTDEHQQHCLMTINIIMHRENKIMLIKFIGQAKKLY